MTESEYPELHNENIVLRVRPDCSQLFLVYAGAMGMPGMPGIKFMRKSGLADRNMALIRDPYTCNFSRGTGCGLDDIDALLDWHIACCDALEHVSEVYCLGNSMGGYGAALFGHLIAAKSVFAFSLEIARAAEEYALEDLATLLGDGDGTTEYHLYYSPDNEVDSANAEALQNCPGVVLHPMDTTNAIAGKPELEASHLLMNSLANTDKLKDLFPPFRAAGTTAARTG